MNRAGREPEIDAVIQHEVGRGGDIEHLGKYPPEWHYINVTQQTHYTGLKSLHDLSGS
jgi:hypothetical protein